jgi:hypothetical protein
MSEARQRCDYCHEEISYKPVRQGDKVYCSEACAFEASRPKKCGDRDKTDVYIKSLDEPDAR